MATPISIDVVSDVVCPWCYVGKRRLERALSQRSDLQSEIRWLPFFLDPSVPREGMQRVDYITRKFGTPSKFTPAHERLTGIGAELGIDFQFDRIERQPNTLDAHRVIAWAQEAGNAAPVVDRLFAMFFTEGADLSDPETLVKAGQAGGLDAAQLREALVSDQDAVQVQRQAAAASSAGIGGVPFFVLNKKLALSGAQEAEVFLAAIDQSLGEVPPSDA
jgi:predicted DsbA family dithiol-disulfide isomerase